MKDIILGIHVNDISVLHDIPGFQCAWEYHPEEPLNSLNGPREYGRLKTGLFIFRFLAFNTDSNHAILPLFGDRNDKDSAEYFMTKMTQEEFEKRCKGKKTQPYKFNMIKEEDERVD